MKSAAHLGSASVLIIPIATGGWELSHFLERFFFSHLRPEFAPLCYEQCSPGLELLVVAQISDIDPLSPDWLSCVNMWTSLFLFPFSAMNSEVKRNMNYCKDHLKVTEALQLEGLLTQFLKED